MKSVFILLIVLAILLPACSPAAAPAGETALPTSSPQLPATPSAAATATPSPEATRAPAVTPLEPVTITAFCTIIGKDAATHIKQNTPVILTWGWEAKTEMQVYDFLQANITTITLDGKEIQGVQVEGIQKNQKSGSPEIVWYAKVGVLPPGTHTVTYDVRWTKMIDDGTTTYGPGGKIETTHDECRIIVE